MQIGLSNLINALLTAAVASGQIPPPVKPFGRQVHRLSCGLPRALIELLGQFAAGHSDLSRRAGLQLFKPDRHIKNLPAMNGTKRGARTARFAISQNLIRADKVVCVPNHDS